jgi:S-adenosylmethionine hydrolase
MLLHLIGDYGVGDLSFAEVASRLKRLIPECEVFPTPVPAFNTIAAGFIVAQLALNNPPPGTVIFENVAPRLDDDGPRAQGAGEPLVCAFLPEGVKVIGVLAGHAFSFLKDAGVPIRRVNCAASGSQFRSRDLFPDAIARIVRGDDGVLGDPISPDDIPDMPHGVICYVDGFGNIKTTWRVGEVEGRSGDLLRIRIYSRVFAGNLATGQNFDVRHGELGLTPGSSGWRGADGRTFRFLEVFLRGGSAWELFGRPPIGEEVEVGKLVGAGSRPPRVTPPAGYTVPRLT